jgi:hypothetical protein
MTGHDRCPPVCVPPLPPVLTPSERLAIVCSVVAPPLSPLWPAPVLPVPRVTLAASGRGSPLLGHGLTVVATIGSTFRAR